MKFYRYWIKCQRDLAHDATGGQPRQVTVAYGHSDLSPDDARACGERLLDRLQQRILGGTAPAWSYDTTERPIREEILRVITPQNVVTRNRYGAEVLNSSELVIVDLDGELPPTNFSLKRLLTGLFGAATPSGNLSQAEVLERVAALARRAECQEFPIRVYRTKAGYRLIIDCVLDGKECKHLMEAFHADPLYATLCQAQDCYRARLTPKPHRLRLRKCRFNFPETDAAVLAAQQAWLEEYTSRSRDCAVCRYLGSINAPDGRADHPVIRFHDDRTGAMSDRPLT